MKKVFFAIVLLALALSLGTTALAGSVPEDLFADTSLLFFGETLSYDAETGDITVLPTQTIKGDVQTGSEQTYKRGAFTWHESFAPEGEQADFPVEGEVYLMAYFDANNPLYVFRVTSTDTKTLELVGIDPANMFGRLQTYLNDGTYAQKEAERVERLATQAAEQAQGPTNAALAEPPPAPEGWPGNAAHWVIGLSVAAIGICLFTIFVGKKKIKK